MPTIAILGASSDRAKFGNKAVRAFLQKGFTVYPVNPKGEEIENLKTFRALADVPAGKLDLINVYLPPSVGLKVLDEIAERGCDELWLNPGSDSPEVVTKAHALGLNVVQACSIVGIGVSPASLED